MANSFDRIYAVVKKIPRGTVASYGQVALLAGNPRWARVVGYALHANPDPEGIPCGNERWTNVTGVCVRRRGHPARTARSGWHRVHRGRPRGYGEIRLDRIRVTPHN